ncbi:hypothetical protein A3762_07030 [Oleiphilus sp. HI0125]|uniref:alpha/beta fold hydrolase n=1 Tax=Oleiphilus sp. HI0125 TaxID=1822266 RepID=UPI0007C2A8EB|nr:alpha/beta hydrolase [Oleiphilus sp. HI0125]KZZ58739.1 hypothetical protein A3762_07030 [Oleiphilus sp. HI0125]
MFRILKVALVTLSIVLLGACTNMKGASKSSTSLTSFLGFSELPDWYITSRYTYPDSDYRDNDFGLPVHFRDVGEGDTIVLIHGELSSVHTWNRWVEILRQEFRVIAIDLPGSGLTGAPRCIRSPEDLCPENLSRDYLSHTLTYLIEDLKLRNFHLVGASYGGYLAARYAIDNPNKVKTLTLVSPLGMQQEPPFMVRYLDNTGLLSEYFQPSTIVTTMVDDFYANPEKITPDTLQRYIHLLQGPGAHATNVRHASLARELMEYGTQETLSNIENRALIMWGNKDKWGDFEHAERWVEEVPNAMMVEYKGIGHLAMEEHAEDSAYDLIAFINDEPLPTLEGLGRNSFTLQDAVNSVGDKEALFGDGLPEMTDEQ